MDQHTGLPVVAMVGAGQLARMTHQAAIALGQSLRVLANDHSESAALVATDVRLGDYRDLETLRQFAAGADALTFDHEHVPTEHLHALVSEGFAVHPGPEALVFAQDKAAMRERLSALGHPVPRWVLAREAGELTAFGDKIGWPIIAKTPRGGYDGKGVWVIDDAEQGQQLLNEAGPLVLEEKVALRRELAAVVARSPFGQVAAWPVVETVQENGVCVEVLAPAPDLAEDRALQAQKLAIDIAHQLGVVGILAVELFELDNGDLQVNELAMRPHNSGHWTIEGSGTSQFEQHVRAVLDYPLGHTGLRAPAVVMANILGGAPSDSPDAMGLDERIHHMFAADPGIKLHLYGKQLREGRKVGHVTVLDDDMTTARRRAQAAVALLRDGVSEHDLHKENQS